MPCNPVCHIQRDRTTRDWFCPGCDVPFPPPPSFLDVQRYAPIRGTRTFQVRGILKQLGGRWQPTAKVWWVPVSGLNQAIEATESQTDPAGSDAAADDDLFQFEWQCWECGEPLRQQQWAAALAIKRKGVGQDDYWCGCTED